MKLSVRLVLVNGHEMEDTTSDFLSVQAAIETYQKLLNNPSNTLTWGSKDGSSVAVISSSKIVAIQIQDAP